MNLTRILIDQARAGASGFAETAVVGAAVAVTAVASGTLATPMAIALALVAGIAAMTSIAAGRAREARRLREVGAALQGIVDGDLLSTVDVPQAGAARIVAQPAAALAGRLTVLLSENQRIAALLEDQWQRMNDVAWAMSSTAEGTVKDVSAAATSAAEVSERIGIIAQGAEETAMTIKDVADHASQASSVAAHGAAQVTAASTTFEELRAASKRVESIVKLIMSIASQTHLLALNAAIEAARAGEHGRGFAVVASEVKQLAEATAQATDDVIATMQDIEDGSRRAAEAMTSITTTIGQVHGSQSAIAAAVVQQTAITESIGDSSTAAADRATALASSVQALTDAVRLTAYTGAQARTVAAETATAEQSLRSILSGFRFVPVAAAETAAVEPRETGVTTADGITTVQNYVTGVGINEFNYQGKWGHATANVEADGTNSHSSMPGDTATIRFTGRRIRFFGVAAPNHGIASISLDGGPETEIDQFGEARLHGVMDYESPVLPRSEHTLKLTVLGKGNPKSRYVWINVDKVEIVD